MLDLIGIDDMGCFLFKIVYMTQILKDITGMFNMYNWVGKGFPTISKIFRSAYGESLWKKFDYST